MSDVTWLLKVAGSSQLRLNRRHESRQQFRLGILNAQCQSSCMVDMIQSLRAI